MPTRRLGGTWRAQRSQPVVPSSARLPFLSWRQIPQVLASTHSCCFAIMMSQEPQYHSTSWRCREPASRWQSAQGDVRPQRWPEYTDMLHLLHQPALFSGERSSSTKTLSTGLDSWLPPVQPQAERQSSASAETSFFMIGIPLSFRAPILWTAGAYVHRRELRPGPFVKRYAGRRGTGSQLDVIRSDERPDCRTFPS